MWAYKRVCAVLFQKNRCYVFSEYVREEHLSGQSRIKGGLSTAEQYGFLDCLLVPFMSAMLIHLNLHFK